MKTALTKEMIAEVMNYIPNEEELKAADKEASIIVLSQGLLADNKPYYAYMAIPPSKYRLFKLAEAQGNFKLNDYGEILYFEKKAEPSQAVIEMMEKEYGIDHNFEDTLHKLMNESSN